MGLHLWGQRAEPGTEAGVLCEVSRVKAGLVNSRPGPPGQRFPAKKPSEMLAHRQSVSWDLCTKALRSCNSGEIYFFDKYVVNVQVFLNMTQTPGDKRKTVMGLIKR